LNNSKPDIKYLFEPRSVAVVGASASPDKVGYKIVENILSGGYKGRIYPINPKGGEVLGLPIAKSLAEIGEPIDMACISVPAKFVLDSFKDCAASGVKFLPVITSGFSETGNVAGERDLVSYALDHGMRVMGPNIFGIYSANSDLNATFGPKIQKGHVAIITQSGALGIGMIGKTAVANIGLSTMSSVGNKADITEADLLEYLVDDAQTKVIMLYTEGIRDGERLIATLSRVTRRKPVIMVKSGRSKRGAMAAASHTGALAGSDEILDDFNWCKSFTSSAAPRGENTVIITNGGGIGVMATDACEKYQVPLYDDVELMKAMFAKEVPEFGSTKNPIDLTGQARSADYDGALAAALRQESIHAVIALYCETAVFDVDNLATMIRENTIRYRDGGKPIVFSLFGGEPTERAILSLRKDNTPVFEDTYSAVSCLGALMAQYRYTQAPAAPPEDADVPLEEINKVLDKAAADGRSFLLAHEGQRILEMCGISFPKSSIARSLDEAVKAAEAIGYPVVMKVVSRDILHKSDVGGVALNLLDQKEVMDAYEAILFNCRKHDPKANIEGVEVNEMVQKGTETIVGARRDRSLGPIVMCGMGGVYVEVMKDVSFRAVHFSKADILSMLKGTKLYSLLLGVRGEDKKDMEKLLDAIIKLGSLIKKCDRISDIEINPLVVYEEGVGVKALDVRVLLSERRQIK
jgi:acetate---CoA ligase (ADP-forming)